MIFNTRLFSLIVFLFVAFCNAGFSFAGEPQVTASLSSSQVPPGETFQLVLSVKTEDSATVSPPQWNPPNGVSHEGTESRTSIESRLTPGPNGMTFKKNRSIDFVYNLKANKEGHFKLGPFIFKVDGQQHQLGAVNLNVSGKAASGKIPRRRGGLFPPGFDDEESLLEKFFGQGFSRPPTEEKVPSRQMADVDVKDPFFVRVETDKTQAFEGEQVFASWYIYTRGNIQQFDRLKFPTLKGFWKEDVEAAPNLNFEKEMVNGVLFHRALLASYALFPISKGTTTIDEYRIRALISVPTGGLGGFGFGETKSFTKESPPLNIEVKPLPTEGRTENFTGAVGQFKVEAHVDQQNFVQGQALTLKLRFEGDGNAKLIELPSIHWPENLELYDTKSEARFFQSGKSYKDFTLLVIPKQSGIVKIPPLEFTYFDPTEAVYKVMKTQEIGLQIAAGEAVKEEAERMKAEEDALKPEIPVLPLPEKTPRTLMFYWLSGRSLYLVMGSLYFLVFAGLGLWQYLWLRKANRQRSYFDDLKDRRLRWEKLQKSGNKALSAAELINAIYFILSRLADDEGYTKDLAYLMDHLPPSIRGVVDEPLRRELEVLQTVAFAPEEGWGELKEESQFRKHSERTFQLLEQTIQLANEGTSTQSS